MPTYDYVCDQCEHAFELFQQMTAPVKRKCPECGKPKLRRLVGTGAGVIFKGSGFYETDYRSDSYKKAAEADKTSKTDKDTKPKADGSGAPETPAKTSASNAPSPPAAGSDTSASKPAKSTNSKTSPKPK